MRHLRYFVALAEERHFGRAAARLELARPPLSRQIRDLEDQVGAELFDRSTRPIQLTAAGAGFLREARFILRQTERAIEQAGELARSQHAPLHLSVATFPFLYSSGMFPRIVGAFKLRVGQASLDLCDRSPPDQLDAIAKEWLDIGFTRQPIETSAVQAERLLDQKLVAIVSERHRLAHRSALSLTELVREPFVSVSKDVAPGFVYDQTTQLARRNLSPSIVYEAPAVHAQLELVAAGAGVGLHLAPHCEGTFRHRGVAFIPLADDTPPVAVTLIWRRKDDREIVRSFLDSAREIAQSLQQP